MAIGFFKKLKNGLVKAWNGIKKGAKWVNNKVLKPVLKPIANAAAPIVNGIVPGLGTAIQTGVNTASGLIDGSPSAKSQVMDWANANIPVRYKR